MRGCSSTTKTPARPRRSRRVIAFRSRPAKHKVTFVTSGKRGKLRRRDSCRRGIQAGPKPQRRLNTQHRNACGRGLLWLGVVSRHLWPNLARGHEHEHTQNSSVPMIIATSSMIPMRVCASETHRAKTARNRRQDRAAQTTKNRTPATRTAHTKALRAALRATSLRCAEFPRAAQARSPKVLPTETE